MASDLDAPLSRRKARLSPGQARRQIPIARLAALGIAVLLVAVTLRVFLVDDPEGGRPWAEVAINSTRSGNSIVGSNLARPSADIIAIGPEIPVSELGNATEPPLENPPVEPAAEEVEEVATLGPDIYGNLPDLVEQTEFGAIPRIGGDGQTPFLAYSRPSVTSETAGGRPLIAIVVTGLGLNLAGSLEAIEKLPETVTLAFAPYGKNLDRTVEAARAEGHEIFLEVPLEPFDYPENDPGPDTLLTGQAPRDNMRKLFKVMSKFGGYAALINNMGARFTASGADFGPMMEELGARGLGYLDDGSSNRSLAPQLAQANRVPFGRVDMMLDGNPARGPILAALAQLEARARLQGSAVGLISALPVSVQTVAEWAASLEEKGIVIVPASALMKK